MRLPRTKNLYTVKKTTEWWDNQGILGKYLQTIYLTSDQYLRYVKVYT
jgi:hypothetical protein